MNFLAWRWWENLLFCEGLAHCLMYLSIPKESSFAYAANDGLLLKKDATFLFIGPSSPVFERDHLEMFVRRLKRFSILCAVRSLQIHIHRGVGRSHFCWDSLYALF